MIPPCTLACVDRIQKFASLFLAGREHLGLECAGVAEGKVNDCAFYEEIVFQLTTLPMIHTEPFQLSTFCSHLRFRWRR